MTDTELYHDDATELQWTEQYYQERTDVYDNAISNLKPNIMCTR